MTVHTIQFSDSSEIGFRSNSSSSCGDVFGGGSGGNSGGSCGNIDSSGGNGSYSIHRWLIRFDVLLK